MNFEECSYDILLLLYIGVTLSTFLSNEYDLNSNKSDKRVINLYLYGWGRK